MRSEELRTKNVELETDLRARTFRKFYVLRSNFLALIICEFH
jgi:hypothetical protein